MKLNNIASTEDSHHLCNMKPRGHHNLRHKFHKHDIYLTLVCCSNIHNFYHKNRKLNTDKETHATASSAKEGEKAGYQKHFCIFKTSPKV